MKSASWMNPIKARNLSESIKHVDGYCWNAFQRDYAQIVHSDFFKRLSGKTQVHSFPLNDHLRTRLTHSIEASQIGRQISRYFCKKLNDKGMFEKNTRHYDDFSNRLEELTGAACLLHDIGHPPFGHVGTHLLNKLSHKFSEEFDDNKQAFRISLSKVWHEKFDPSAPLIAAIMKKNEVDKVAYKTEHVSLKNLLFHLKIPDLRHPASFFMEAADDIAYIAADFSDYLQYFVDYSQFQKMLSHSDINKLNTITVLKNDFSEDDKNLFGKLTEIYNTNFEKSGEAILEFSTSLIKNLLANVFDSIDVFMNNNEFSSLDEIPSKLKNFTIEHATQKDTNLLYLKCTKYGELFYNLKKKGYSEFILDQPYIGSQNLMAEKVLSELFEHFHKLIDFNYNKSDVFKLVPYDFQNYLHAAHKGEQDSTPARVVLDFISGMTDQYALDTWKLVSQPHYLRFTG